MHRCIILLRDIQALEEFVASRVLSHSQCGGFTRSPEYMAKVKQPPE
jgi:hypothetical protein